MVSKEMTSTLLATSTVLEIDMSAVLAAANGSTFSSTALATLLNLQNEGDNEKIEVKTESSREVASECSAIDVVNTAAEDISPLHTGLLASPMSPVQKFSHSQIAPSSQLNAMNRAVATASSMADWAGRAVRRALKEHMNSGNSAIPSGSTGAGVSSSSASSLTLLPRSTSPDMVDLVTEVQPRNPEQTPEKVAVTSTIPASRNWSEDLTKGISKKNVTWNSSVTVDLIEENQQANDYPVTTQVATSAGIKVKESNDDEVFTSSQTAHAEEEYNISEDEEDLEDSIEDTKRRLATSSRDAERVTEDMKEEVLRLIQAFDFPYIVAPFEAEAQCAVLEELGLVDGVITEDSDALLFGAKAIYKNIFNDRKYVEVYLAKDAEEEMGLTRDDLIALAFFLGSDYTEGVNGVGIVNAMEILQAFPMKEMYGGPLEGLVRFRKWLEGYDFAKDIMEDLERKRNQAQTKASASKMKGRAQTGRGKKTAGKNKKGRSGHNMRCISDSESERESDEESAEEEEADEEDEKEADKSADESTNVKEETKEEGSEEVSLTDLERKMVHFDKRHKHGRSKWTVPASFPDPKVAQAYYHPNANRSEEKFRFDQPSRSKVRRFCRDVLGWTETQMDTQIDPVLQKFAERSNGIQTRMDSHYMMTYNDDTRFAKIASDRLREAVVQITGKRTALSLGVVGLESERRSKSSSSSGSQKRAKKQN